MYSYCKIPQNKYLSTNQIEIKTPEYPGVFYYLILNSSFTLKNLPVKRTGTGYIKLVL